MHENYGLAAALLRIKRRIRGNSELSEGFWTSNLDRPLRYTLSHGDRSVRSIRSIRTSPKTYNVCTSPMAFVAQLRRGW
jgi:hypothetical protein